MLEIVKGAEGISSTNINLAQSLQQATLNCSANCSGVGIHSGESTHLSIHPAEENTGYVFIRTDLNLEIQRVKAIYETVVDTNLCTKIANEHGVTVSTIEHIIAALKGAFITNAIIEVDSQEVPIMDGSAVVFSQIIKEAGVKEQNALMPIVKIINPIKVTHKEAWASFLPSDKQLIDITFDAHGRLKHWPLNNSFSFDLQCDNFADLISDARTFGFYEDAKKLWENNLAKGASLENTVVVHEDKVINPGGLRSDDELIRHKILDAVGDLALSGVIILGEFHGYNSGHGLNNKLLRKLFEE
ncbi:MAG: UDP-3-O-acyl-N-acetylglucosamine deacetylase [Alphaproteobacteria bacterium]